MYICISIDFEGWNSGIVNPVRPWKILAGKRVVDKSAAH